MRKNFLRVHRAKSSFAIQLDSKLLETDFHNLKL